MNLTKINQYICISKENNKIIIYIQEDKFQEIDDILLNKISNDLGNNIVYEGDKGAGDTYYNNLLIALNLWIRNKYDTSILPYELSFPLLKKLVDVGDSLAKKVLIREIEKSFCIGDPRIIKFLLQQNYDRYLFQEQNRLAIHTPKFKESKLTVLICFINILIYVLFSELFNIGNILIFDIQKIVSDFELWRLFTAIFMHSDRFSLFVNTLFLYLIGSYFEANNFGSKTIFLYVYFISGFIGNLVYLLIFPQFPDYNLSSGASGAIFGILGAFGVILIFKKKYTGLIFYLILNFLIYVYTIDPRINYICHLIGIFSGFLFYFTFTLNFTNHRRKTHTPPGCAPLD